MSGQEFIWTAQGYTEFARHSHESRIDDLVRIDPRLRDVRLFQPIVEHLQVRPEDERKRLQTALLGQTDHGFPFTILVGAIAREDATWIREEVTRAFLAFLELVRLRSSRSPRDGKSLDGFLDYLRDQPGQIHAEFLSFLQTSVLNYAREHALPGAGDLFDRMPLYSECGADLMMGPGGPVVAEFNSVAGSYPHVLHRARQACAALLPEFFAEMRVAPESYREDRLDLLARVAREFGRDLEPRSFAKLLVDAWSCQAHPGMSHRDVAERLGAEYLLFDHQLKSENRYPALVGHAQKVFLYNALQLSLLEPDAPYFEPMNRLGFETYEALGWSGVLRDYVAGKTLLSTSPMADLIDDKALIPFFPALVEYFSGRRMTLPVNHCRQLWDRRDPTQPDREALALASRRPEDYVVAHRYLSGGRGIFIGRAMSPDDWARLLHEHVARHPSWFVLRDYFEMDPVYSMRTHICAHIQPGHEGAAVEHVVAGDFFGRLSLGGAIDNVRQGGQVFLGLESSKLHPWMRPDAASQP
jgi:hypothetical protein